MKTPQLSQPHNQTQKQQTHQIPDISTSNITKPTFARATEYVYGANK